MSKPCVICAEPGVRDSVDRRLAEGVSIRDVAAVVNRSKSAVARHKLHGDDERNEKGVKLGVRPKPPRKPGRRAPRVKNGRASPAGHDAGQKPKPIRSKDDLIERFEELRVEAIAIMRESRRRGDNRLALAALNAAQELDVKSGKTGGYMAPDGQTFIDARRQSIAFFDDIPVDEARAMIAELRARAVALPSGESTEEAVDVETRATAS